MSLAGDWGMSNGGSDHRVAHLREERGWSYDRLAEAVHAADPSQDAPTAATMHKLETGGMQLTLRWIKRLAAGFGVQPYEILAPPHEHALPVADDVEQYVPAVGEVLPTVSGLILPVYYRTLTGVVGELGIAKGDVLITEQGSHIADTLTHGDVVIVAFPNGSKGKVERYLLRQFIEPALLITNSRDENAQVLNLRTSPGSRGQIRAIVRSLYRPSIRRGPVQNRP